VHEATIEYEEADDKTGLTRPPDRRILVAGLPGVGKTWIINTLRNITRLLYKRNLADMATTPTGSLAALIQGKTHFRAPNIPTGTEMKQVPTKMALSNKHCF
jgi:hypothetical protein